MGDAMISRLITDLQQPGLLPGLEDERKKLLQLLLQVVRPGIPDHTEHVCFKWQFGEDEDDSDNAVKTWLNEIKAAAYAADDIIDEFRYAKLQAEVETDRHQSDDKVKTSIFSLCKIGGLRRSSEGGMAEEMTGEGLRAIVDRFEDLVIMSNNFISPEGQQQLVPGPEGWQDPTLSSLNEIFEPIIVGRDKEKETIVHELLDLSHNRKGKIGAFSIVGKGGIGKSTLARLVCGDNKIKKIFEYIIWVDVGVVVSSPKIAKSIIDQVIGKDCCISEDDMDLLGCRINQELSGKKILFALDDLWNEGKGQWQWLESWLDQSAATGSSILVTTRNMSAANFMPYSRIYQLSALTEFDLWELFLRRSLIAQKEKMYPEVSKISKAMCRRSRGSPVLANVLAGFVRFSIHSKELRQVMVEMNSWEDFYDTFLTIKMCYIHLPSEIQRCFAFCSVFRRGHYMDKEVLVKLWMANDLISSDGPISVEERGTCIFNELALRNLFEDVKLVPGISSGDKHGYHSRVICKMNDLIHDLACYVSQNEYLCIPESNPTPSEQIRYLSMYGGSQIDVPLLLEEYPHVRTLISQDDPFVRTVNCSVLPKSNKLRVLQLHSAKFDRDQFEMMHAIHLRFLDLSGSRIKRLPESTSSLYFLQILNLSRCLLLCELPQDMRCMSNLRHLYVHGCPKLKKMPVHLRRLGYLKTLTTYIIGENAGNGIDEIKGMNLGGLLELYNLSKVKDATIAKDVDLLSKKNLERLTLCWGGHQVVMSKGNNDLEVLEALQPHDGLKVLKIQQYGGHKFSTWLDNRVGRLNLVELHLIGCPKCETLPAVLWKSSALRVLCLKYMPSITSFLGESLEPFRSLKRLVLVSMKKFERWHNGEAIQGATLLFPVLDEMEITHCPELKTMPSVPMLKYLTISTENHSMVTSVVDLMTRSKSLIEVNMARGSCSDNEELSALVKEGKKCHKLRVMRLNSTNGFFMSGLIPNLQLGFWRSLISLENLDISNCGSIVAWPLEEFRDLTRLKRIAVRMCPNLTGLFPRKLQEGEVHLPQLQALEFYRCQSLEVVPTCSSVLYLELDECPEITSISGFNNLEMLFLSCASWTSLPTGLEDLKNLKSLRVSECSSLTRLPDELAGLTSLQTLIIHKCPKVKSLPGGLDQMLCNYQKFQVSECPDLEKFCEEQPYSSILSRLRWKSDNSAGPSTNA